MARPYRSPFVAFLVALAACSAPMGCGGKEATNLAAGGTGGSGTPTSSATSTATGGSGGESGAGPTGGSGGQSADAASDAPVACDAIALGPVTFHLVAAAGSDYCTTNCGAPWVSIVSMSSGSSLIISAGCTTTCAQCQFVPCGGGACPAPQHVKPEGETYVWDGDLWESSRCGPQMLGCVNPVCPMPGKYVARMCANRSTSDAGPFCMFDAAPTCVDVPFDYPTSAVVEGVLK